MRSEDRKPSKRVFPLLQNLDLDSVTFAQVQGVGDPITIEDMNEQEMVDLIIVNLARLVCAGEWSGLLSAGGGSDATLFAPFSQPEATGEASFIPTCPIATAYGNSFTLDSHYYTPSHYPFFSGDYTEVEEVMLEFTGTAGDAGSTGSFAIYTLSTSSDTGWAVGRPMAMVTNSEVSYATSTSARVEFSPASTVTLEAKTWYSVAIVSDDAYTQFPSLYRAKEINAFWGELNWGGLKAVGETNYTLPASYTTSTEWGASQAVPYIPKLFWRGTN